MFIAAIIAGIVLLALLFHEVIGWVIFGLVIAFWYTFRGFFRLVGTIFSAPFRVIGCGVRELRFAWRHNDPSVFFAKLFTTGIILVLIGKGVLYLLHFVVK